MHLFPMSCYLHRSSDGPVAVNTWRQLSQGEAWDAYKYGDVCATRVSASRPCCLPPSQGRRRPDCAFSKLHTPPTYTSVYASLGTSRCPAQNSRPSGSLLLSRKALSSSTSDRFIPAHWLPRS